MHLILFDIDGTLVDSAALLLATQAATLKRFGIAHPGRDAGLAVVGLSLPEAFRALVGDGYDAEALAAAYKDDFVQFRDLPAYRDELYPGAAETIAAVSALPDTAIGIATGKSRRGVAHLLARHGWDTLFNTIQTADDAPSKPHPAMILQAMSAAGATAERTFMIGDSVHDVRMARAADVTMIAVAWGFQPPTMLVEAGAQHVIPSFDALLPLLSRLMV